MTTKTIRVVRIDAGESIRLQLFAHKARRVELLPPLPFSYSLFSPDHYVPVYDLATGERWRVFSLGRPCAVRAEVPMSEYFRMAAEVTDSARVHLGMCDELSNCIREYYTRLLANCWLNLFMPPVPRTISQYWYGHPQAGRRQQQRVTALLLASEIARSSGD